MAATPAIATSVTAMSVMFAAYAFFFNSAKPTLDAAQQVGQAAADPVVWRGQVHKLERARRTALILSGVAILVWLLFVRAVVSEFESAWDVQFSLRHYSTLDVVFVVFTTAWLILAIWMGSQARAVGASLATLRKAKPREV